MKKVLLLFLIVLFFGCFEQDENPPTIINGRLVNYTNLDLFDFSISLVGSRSKGGIFSPGPGSEDVWERVSNFNPDGTFYFSVNPPRKVISLRLEVSHFSELVLIDCEPRYVGISTGMELRNLSITL